MNNPWNKISRPVSSYNFRRVDPEHPFDFFWAKNIEGAYVFLFKCKIEIIFPQELPKLQGIEIITPPPEINEEKYLIFELLDKSDWDIFLVLCRDLVASSKSMPDQRSALTVIINRLVRWNKLLKNIRSKILSDAEQKGLIGELLFLKNYVFERYPVSDALAFWQGPLGSPQDYCIGNTAIEIKCKIGTSKPYVKITSTDQLSCNLSELYLVVATLGKASCEDEKSITLPKLISEIEEHICTESSGCLELFSDLLIQAGYYSHSEYDNCCFICHNFSCFAVQADFPKILQSEIKEGVSGVTYDIMLEKCIPFKTELETIF